ncbi:hypothetical protein PNH38_07255 [Anoxybacillus rupiensis]|uniref:Uncharacterized protein n=1 Tax=Anoxybacteroides rupiense TaxID=311460 RepID=A0ABT5W3A1_9BACL|nr:hypothetical protein [Anoxybacillus rupiensis]
MLAQQCVRHVNGWKQLADTNAIGGKKRMGSRWQSVCLTHLSFFINHHSIAFDLPLDFLVQ